MKIIILGVGQVGGTLAENLVGERNDITVVDTDTDLLEALQDKYDLQVVVGNGAHPGYVASRRRGRRGFSDCSNQQRRNQYDRLSGCLFHF